MTSRTAHFGRHRRICAVLAALLILPVAACTGGGTTPGATAAPESPGPTASPTPSATPTPTASYKPADASGRAENVPVPVLPEAAKAETKEGAIAFAAYWFSLLSYGYETGDLAPLEAVTSPACGPCEKAKSVIRAWHAEGRWLIGGKITTPSVSSEFIRDEDSTYQVAVQAQQTPLTYMRQDASVARSDPQPDDTGNLLFVTYSDGAWAVADVGRIVG
ncbi:DUF6318 family protein [Pseudarthrobacter sp. 1C304]|uniref:DUF6318 family protein n=1 Tax=Pseudarthrobacter sp. 1C304 TaxID=3457438 RepID=UPI003FD5344B